MKEPVGAVMAQNHSNITFVPGGSFGFDAFAWVTVMKRCLRPQESVDKAKQAKTLVMQKVDIGSIEDAEVRRYANAIAAGRDPKVKILSTCARLDGVQYNESTLYHTRFIGLAFDQENNVLVPSKAWGECPFATFGSFSYWYPRDIDKLTDHGKPKGGKYKDMLLYLRQKKEEVSAARKAQSTPDKWLAGVEEQTLGTPIYQATNTSWFSEDYVDNLSLQEARQAGEAVLSLEQLRQSAGFTERRNKIVLGLLDKKLPYLAFDRLTNEKYVEFVAAPFKPFTMLMVEKGYEQLQPEVYPHMVPDAVKAKDPIIFGDDEIPWYPK